MSIMTHGGAPDGPYNPAPLSDRHANAHATHPSLPRVWGIHVGGFPQFYPTRTTLTDVRRLTRKIRWCITPACPQFHQPYRPEAAGRLALPKHEFGLDIIALIGSLRHAHGA